jgi:hypothetical protein
MQGPSHSAHADRIWLAIAVGGTALALFLAHSDPIFARVKLPAPAQALVCAALVASGVVLVLRLRFGPACGLLLTRPTLLVPAGIVVSLDALLLLGMRMISPTIQPGLSFSPVVYWATTLALNAAYAAWQTDLLARAVQGEAKPSVSPWAPIRRGFARTLVVLLLGTAVLALLTYPFDPHSDIVNTVQFLLGMRPSPYNDLHDRLAAAIDPIFGVRGYHILHLILVIMTLLTNLTTVTLLPAVLTRPDWFGAAFTSGLRQSWLLARRLWPELLAQLLLLGLVTIYVHGVPLKGRFEHVWFWHQFRLGPDTVYWVHPIWVGGYWSHGYWYDDYTKYLMGIGLPLVSQSLDLMYLFMAVAMKLTIIRHLLAAKAMNRPPDV